MKLAIKYLKKKRRAAKHRINAVYARVLAEPNQKTAQRIEEEAADDLELRDQLRDALIVLKAHVASVKKIDKLNGSTH